MQHIERNFIRIIRANPLNPFDPCSILFYGLSRLGYLECNKLTSISVSNSKLMGAKKLLERIKNEK